MNNTLQFVGRGVFITHSEALKRKFAERSMQQKKAAERLRLAKIAKGEIIPEPTK